MRRPKPPKTRKAVAKRFKITATGKILRASSGKRHLMQHKNSKRRRRLTGTCLVSASDANRIRLSLPFGL